MSSSPVGGRILVVDDDEDLLRMMTAVLTAAGYFVCASSSGRKALEALEKDTFDAVLSDVQMPGLDGHALLRAIHERDLDVPVVLMTGGPTLNSAIEALEHGALQYLIKPMPSEAVLAALHRAVKIGALSRLRRSALLASGFNHLVDDRADLDRAFARALDHMWMALQPIVRVDGSLYAHEALVRTDEDILPDASAFVSAAQRLGRLPEFGRRVRATVAGIFAQGRFTTPMFVNLHPEDLTDDELLDPGAPLSLYASRVVLEVTERAGLAGMSNTAERLRAIRRLGYRVALDDLGAGYAGLNSFATLSPDVVKLDMALVRGMDQDGVKEKLVRSMTRLCQDLGILVVAEGIETAGERLAAARSGCDLFQGYLIGRPERAGG
jgi:EAL domain-containing protein (putative c-di-GMP-specific phosphodiesterase class I)/CheY-like chemotaxis protein